MSDQVKSLGLSVFETTSQTGDVSNRLGRSTLKHGSTSSCTHCVLCGLISLDSTSPFSHFGGFRLVRGDRLFCVYPTCHCQIKTNLAAVLILDEDFTIVSHGVSTHGNKGFSWRHWFTNPGQCFILLK